MVTEQGRRYGLAFFIVEMFVVSQANGYLGFPYTVNVLAKRTANLIYDVFGGTFPCKSCFTCVTRFVA